MLVSIGEAETFSLFLFHHVYIVFHLAFKCNNACMLDVIVDTSVPGDFKGISINKPNMIPLMPILVSYFGFKKNISTQYDRV